MAVLLQITYSKKLGLPNYSSHNCSLSLTVEIPDVSAVAQESTKLYQLLQDAVDSEIKHVGFMPDATTYGMNNGNGRGQTNGSNGHYVANGANHANGHQNGNGTNGHNHVNGSNGDQWRCSDGQKGFILRLVNEHRLDKQEVDDLSHQLFRVGVKDCDKMQASQLIEELLEKTGKSKGHRRWTRPQPTRS